MQPTNGQAGAAVKLLVFDMGHVFIDFDWEAVQAGFCRASGRSSGQLRRAFAEVARLGYESGRIDSEGFLFQLNKRLGTTLSLSEFRELWTVSFHENKDMVELFETLKQQRPLYLLSNTNEIHYEYLQSTFNVARHFQELILSYRVGCSKPDPSIYQEVFRRSGFAAEQCLFIDDLETNVKAAAETGMQAIRFTGVDDLKMRLTSLGFTV